MTQEEKARAYDEALERAKSAIKNCGDNKGRIAMIESIFPVLYQSDDERIRKRLIDFFEDWREYRSHCWGVAVTDILAWLEKQGDCSAKWEKNTADNKPTLNHSVLMKNIHGIAEGEWNGKEWIQYRWSSNIKDSDVLAWMELSDLDEQGEQKHTEWSDEDENMANDLIEGFLSSEKTHHLVHTSKEIVDWLKSLKDRVQGKEEKK